ncbi:DUF1206 domain-containing protein [Marinobacteraceae bacterium S3BR75-40.1]
MTTTPKPDHHDAIQLFARVGYSARAVVYLLVGGFAILAIAGPGGRTTGSRGALESLLAAPLGSWLLGATALGLVGYAVWRSVQALGDADHHGTGFQGLVIRAGLGVSAITHLALAFFAASLIFTFGGSGQSGSSGGSEGVAGWLMSQPYGQWLVGLVGLAVIGAGVAQLFKAGSARFARQLDMSPPTQTWAYPIVRFGLAARGLVFVLSGIFFVSAAYLVNPEQAGGIAEVFDTLRNQAYGTWLLAIVAAGLLAFGIYSVLEAIYRRVDP